MVEVRSSPYPAPRLNRRPGLIIDNAQLRHFLPVPFARGVFASNALAGRRIFQKSPAIIDDHAAIKFVVKNPIASLWRSEKRRGIPSSSARSLNAFAVEVLHNAKRAFATRIFAERSAHDLGFRSVDGAAATFFAFAHDIVAVALANLSQTDAFVLTHAVSGVLRAFVAAEDRAPPLNDLEQVLTRLIAGLLLKEVARELHCGFRFWPKAPFQKIRCGPTEGALRVMGGRCEARPLIPRQQASPKNRSMTRDPMETIQALYA